MFNKKQELPIMCDDKNLKEISFEIVFTVVHRRCSC